MMQSYRSPLGDALPLGQRTPATPISYYALLAIVNTLARLPFPLLYALSDLLFLPFYHLIRYRRKIVRQNLTESFPHKNNKQIRRIEKKFYHAFLDIALESCKLLTVSPQEIKQHIKFTNIETANELLSEGQSVALFMGHFGNWEWVSSISLWTCKEAVPAQIYKKLSNRAADSIMKKLRSRWGNVCVPMHSTARYIATAVKRGTPLLMGFIADQSPRKKDAKHYLPFLNHNAPVLTGPEKITGHFHLHPLFLSINRVKRGYYECELIPLLDDTPAAPPPALTQHYYQHLEQEILRQPELYLWTHKRFRHAQPLNP